MTISSKDILDVATAVTKTWTKQRKAEERGSRSRASRCYMYSDRVNFTDIADEIIPGAFAHASGGGKYSVSKRQLFYACREAFKGMADRELEYGYFANTLLVQYLNRHPETADWRITADPRGTLIIPNAAHEKRIPVGTLQIDDHLKRAASDHDPLAVAADVDIEWPSLAAGVRYQAVMYIEKEGFGPLLEEAKIGERFDIAIMSCKGQSVVAARKFVDQVCAVAGGVPLLVVHDFDKAGFEIAQRLTQVSDWAEDCDRVTYRFENEIDVHDLGLRLKDVEEYGLHGEECEFKGGFARDSIATAEEQTYLRSGRRVELNELTSPQFIEWLEAKLKQHLPERLLPNDAALADAYRRACVAARFNLAIERIQDEVVEAAQSASIPEDLRQKVKLAMKKAKTSWDKTLYDMVHDELESKLSEDDGD